MLLTSPITLVPKIGPKFAKLLEKLEIKTVGDLLYHFPFRYDDFSQIKKIKDLAQNDVCTVKGTLEKITNVFTKTGKKFTKAVIADETGEVQLIWFNMHYIKNTLLEGKTYNVSGKVSAFNSQLTFISPEIEEEGSSANTGRLVPIYPETSGISSKWLRSRINDILFKSALVPDGMEFLPKEIRENYNFLDLYDALIKFHFPTSEFEAITAKKRFAYEELFLELLRVEGKRVEWEQKLNGVELDTKSKKVMAGLEKLKTSLPFELSATQLSAIEHIKQELSGKIPMNRLLEGDVGSGKTIVAVFASFITYLCGYKSLYMAPTEILAKQHYETFSKLLGKFGLKIELKTGSTKDFDQTSDIIIGTHALIFIEEKLPKIGLVIVDEQHRFGVEQRAKLLQLGSQGAVPNLLTMTATPIPRTLALTIYGDLAISSLKAPTNKQKNIKTWILHEKKRQNAFDWIANQDKSTFIVCPLIEESESESLENVRAAQVEYGKLKKGVFKGKKVGLLHGRMTSAEKQKVIDGFKTGKIKILVSTPVIEVGVDIPEATIIVIESAERYGLASLHQLRGRVGRAGQEGYCLVFTSNNSRHAFERLKNLEKHNDGLELAEIDMGLRGHGDIYGTMQHGYVRFKLADFNDTKLLENAKNDAKEYFEKLANYPKLQEKLKGLKEKLVHNN